MRLVRRHGSRMLLKDGLPRNWSRKHWMGTSIHLSFNSKMERFVILWYWRGTLYFFLPFFVSNYAKFWFTWQSKSIETTEEALTQANNASLPPLMNPTMLEASDDLTNLSHLNEPAGRFPNTMFLESSSWLCGTVLQAIRLRYLQKEIYTYSGIVLIATNPFARVDSLYVPGMVQVYAGRQRATQAPHLFAIAEEAFAYVATVQSFGTC